MVVAETRNPAAPFYFFVYAGDQGYQIHGEGIGSKAASSAALADIRRLTEVQIGELLRATKAGS